MKRYSIRTEEAYVQWIKRFVLFHDKRHPRDMGPEEVRQFLTHLAVTHRVAASTQNQALSAILFLYKAVLQQDIGWIDEIVWAKKPKRLPVVLTREEVKAVLQHLSGQTWLMASLLYGSGLRLSECLRLRVKDVDVSYHQITVRDGKGAQDRVTMLPERLNEALQAHVRTIQQLHQRDLEDGFGRVYLPDALARKYPNASREWAWQYIFPAARRTRDPRSGMMRRHHVMPLVLQRAVKAAVRQTGMAKAASCHAFRHVSPRMCWKTAPTFARCRNSWGTKMSRRTMIYTHVLHRGGPGTRSPMDWV